MRRLSIHFTRLILPSRITPDMLTATMGVLGIAAAVVLTVPALWSALVMFVLLQLQLLLDCSDGELARWRGPAGGARGVYIDNLSHWVTDACLLAAVAVRADNGLGSIDGWTTVGLATAVLALLVHAETDLVYVARAKLGLRGARRRQMWCRRWGSSGGCAGCSHTCRSTGCCRRGTCPTSSWSSP